MKTLLVFALGLFALPALADNPFDGQNGRKEDRRFEAENVVKTRIDWRSFKALKPLLNDGIGGVEYTGTFSGNDGRSQHALKLRLESSLFSICKGKYDEQRNLKAVEKDLSGCIKHLSHGSDMPNRILILPVQLTARLNLNPQKSGSALSDEEKQFLVTQLKASILRVVGSHGFTFEAMGYLNQWVMTNAANPNEGFRLQGLELASLSMIQTFEPKNTDFIQVSMRLGASFGLGWANSSVIRENLSGPNAGDSYNTNFVPKTDNGVALKLGRRFLAEFYGGTSFVANLRSDGDKKEGTQSVKTHLVHPYIGGRLNLRLIDGRYYDLDLTGSIQKDYLIFKNNNEETDNFRNQAITVNGGITGRY